ncbi:hypothetical protein BGZ89_002880 [Linnemannia elongata]|nr:hypothetical protein BGZ89_002880 [Linnemannia elongata]
MGKADEANIDDSQAPVDLSSETIEQNDEEDEDSAKMEQLLELSEHENAEARCDVGRCYKDGRRVPVDLSKSSSTLNDPEAERCKIS